MMYHEFTNTSSRLKHGILLACYAIPILAGLTSSILADSRSAPAIQRVNRTLLAKLPPGNQQILKTLERHLDFRNNRRQIMKDRTNQTFVKLFESDTAAWRKLGSTQPIDNDSDWDQLISPRALSPNNSTIRLKPYRITKHQQLPKAKLLYCTYPSALDLTRPLPGDVIRILPPIDATNSTTPKVLIWYNNQPFLNVTRKWEIRNAFARPLGTGATRDRKELPDVTFFCYPYFSNTNHPKGIYLRRMQFNSWPPRVNTDIYAIVWKTIPKTKRQTLLRPNSLLGSLTENDANEEVPRIRQGWLVTPLGAYSAKGIYGECFFRDARWKDGKARVEVLRRKLPHDYHDGFTVSLAHATRFKGELLADDPGWKQYKGECAAGVQYVFYKAGNPIPTTPDWKQGPQVKGNNIRPGTAIASFRNGTYQQDHAAIFVRETASGLEVWDQFNNTRSGEPKPWGKRILWFGSNSDRSNNGNLFYVITK